jgi:hypothetical protein
MYSAEILFAGICFSGSFVHLDGVRILFTFSPYYYSVADLIFSSYFHHASLGHDHVPYVLGK